MNKILFAGTPEISVPLLRALASSFYVVGVLTNTDKPQGRSSVLVPSPVKVAALELGIPVIQFDTIKSEAREAVSGLGADTLVSFAFGRIFGPKFLALFPQGRFNVHPSALPVFRGPSPIQATILNSLKTASISLQVIGEKMDEGDIYSRLDFDLKGNETAQSLTDIVAEKASQFVPKVLKEVFAGSLKPQAQIGEPSYCSMLGREDALLNFNLSALEVHSKIRAMNPWPKALAQIKNEHRDVAVSITGVWGDFDNLASEPLIENVKPGTVIGLRKDRGIGIACKDKAIWVTSLQLPSKKEMDFKSFANGNSWILDSCFNC